MKMRSSLPALISLSVALNACMAEHPVRSQDQASLLGTWAEIVTATPTNPTDGRQVIERFANGAFKLVFVKTHPALPPCTGTWSASASTYRMTFTSLSCFSPGSPQPELGAEILMEVVESSASRLRFNVPTGAPVAAWQAKLEGGIN